jgi:uncharacterized DUF497 family protein
VRLVIDGLKGFEWDAGNWRKSEKKHGIAAVEAEEVLLSDPLCQVDPRHSEDEQRYVALEQRWMDAACLFRLRCDTTVSGSSRHAP